MHHWVRVPQCRICIIQQRRNGEHRMPAGKYDYNHKHNHINNDYEHNHTAVSE
jgi:hypothetical protein